MVTYSWDVLFLMAAMPLTEGFKDVVPLSMEMVAMDRKVRLCFKDGVFLPFESTFGSTIQLAWRLTSDFIFDLFICNLAQSIENRI